MGIISGNSEAFSPYRPLMKPEIGRSQRYSVFIAGHESRTDTTPRKAPSH